MKKSTSIIVLILIVLIVGLVFINNEENHSHEDEHGHEHEEHTIEAREPVRADGTFSIATSFYPLAFAAETITQDLAEVTNIGAGRDPHDVQLSTNDVAAMQQADLVVLQGTDLEPWGDDMTKQLQREGVPVFIATHDLELMEGGHDHHDDEHEEEGHHDESEEAHGDEEHGEDGHHDSKEHEDEHGHEEGHDEKHEDDHGHDHGAYDPHTWLDPVLFGQSVRELVEALETLDPENKDTYEERGASLLAELEALDAEYSERLANCSLNEVITSHDAFGYIGERYGFEIHAIAGLSTQDTPSAQTLAELREEAAEGVGAVLLEENSVTAYGETLAADTGLKTLSINPVAYQIADGEDYFSIMRANLAVFAEALQCN